MADTTVCFEARVAPDGRITSLSDLTGAAQRSVQPHSREGVAILKHGRGLLYRFGDDEQVRDLPYLDLLQAMRQNILLTAHKARHGELVDEPEALPALKGLLAGIEDTAEAFRRALRSGADHATTDAGC
jgi:glycerophosphoryl diester phosphodiesterase